MAKAKSPELREYRHDSGEILTYRFIRSARKTLGLYVHRDSSITVRVPWRVTLTEVHIFMHQRWDWLQHQRQRFRNEPAPLQLRLCSGAIIMHLGKPYTLLLESGSRAAVRIEDDKLIVKLPLAQQAEEEKIAKAIDQWQRKIAKELFAKRLQLCHQAMHELNLPMPTIRIRRMRSRWGSCSRQGDITLNLELLRMPMDCIDYVVIHELCHLKVFNHSPAFYALQSCFMPDWSARKQQLEALARQVVY